MLFKIFAFFLVLYFTALSQAQPSSAQVQALVPNLIPLAEKARKAVLNHPSLAPFEIEFRIRETVKRIGLVVKGPQDADKGIEVLETLTPELGPLKDVAHHQIHRGLGFLQGDLGRIEEQAYHRAFGIALLIAFSKTGDGKSHETAFKIVSIDEEYVWFEANRDSIQAVKRVSVPFKGRTHDVWTIRHPKTGEESLMYFDAGDMAESALRVLEARAQRPVQAATQ